MIKKMFQPLKKGVCVCFALAFASVVFQARAAEPINKISHIYAGLEKESIKLIEKDVHFQGYEIKGTITDEAGKPLVGVNIVEAGTSNGVVSDFDGNYTVLVKSSKAVLVYTYLGFSTIKKIVSSKATINVVMQEDLSQLDEVVLIGYGSVKKADNTGATASIKSDKFSKDRVVVDIQDALKGKLSGVQITQSQGGPSSGSTVIIRGATSLTGENNPLYIVDGVPMDNFDLNASNVASVDVLKDAASTAIYGSRGANGVILVTTKKAKKGVSKFDVTSVTGFSDISKQLELLDAGGWVKQIYYQNSNYVKFANRGGITYDPVNFDYYQDDEGNVWSFNAKDVHGEPNTYKNYENWPNTVNTNWQDALYRTGVYQNHDLAFSSGKEHSTIRVSLNYLDQEGIMPNNKTNKVYGTINTTNDINDYIKLSTNSYYSKTKVVGFTGVVQNALVQPPIKPLEGTYDVSHIPGNRQEGVISSPVKLTELMEQKWGNSVFQTNLIANVKFNDKLSLSVQGSYRGEHAENNSYHPKTTIYGRDSRGVANYHAFKSEQMVNTNILSFNDKIGDNHNFAFMLGGSIESNKIKQFITKVNGFAVESLGYNGIAGGDTPGVPVILSDESKLLSSFGRLNYNYKDKYLLKATVRTDGSSKFAKNKKWGYFPSAAIAWKLSNEKFAKNISGFPNTKFRASWGRTGKQALSPYQSISAIDVVQTTINGVDRALGSITSRPENPNLQWETVSETDIGIDLAFAKNKYIFSADVYRKTTEDLLLAVSTPGYTGFTSQLVNLGKLQNEGLELQLDATPFRGGDFTWNSNFNISFNKSKVIEIGEDNILYLDYGILKEGEEIGEWFGYQTQGLWQTQAEIDAAIADGFISQNGTAASVLYPGDSKFVDQNDDGIIDSFDRVSLGRSSPDFTGGFSNYFTYKGFALNVMLQFSSGSKIFNHNRIWQESGRGFANSNAATANRWYPTLYTYDPANPDNKELVHQGTGTNYIRRVKGQDENILTDHFIEDGSFIRLSDVSISYNLSNEVVSKLGISSLRLFVTGKNLKVWTKYKGYDPEVNTGRYKSLLSGFDGGAYPRETTLAVGLNVSL
ncbi:SusC/RagA family TonB-linked outer membrane protein [Flavivirga spongiicola]|uniref:TonB-dependent receptor n=1 Tax=Flavivirga spongiicola TaxID=421621 RepID=A0ABU7XQ49_9FLAO|nr:TonB-dependent receptor [Flavivirga sp. MEBiC05379]MDO5977900.1 TonB-dependent receptor [Flavivirga sp. MEBiC05379]